MPDRSTTREPSRFRPDYAALRPAFPVQVGSCRYCYRPVWHGRPKGKGLLAPAPRWPGACDTCGTWMDDHPGEDPRDHRSTSAERLPAERGEDDPSWRRDPRRYCAGADPVPFEPDPDEDEPGPRVDLDRRRQVAVELCGPCPVRETCAANALAHGYEGVWGGLLCDRLRWENLLTGEQGFTIHATPAYRRDFLAAQAVPA